MPDWGTVHFLIPSTLFLLATVALVLWPIFVAVLEVSKAIRSAVREPRRFTLTNDGPTIWGIFLEREEQIVRNPIHAHASASIMFAQFSIPEALVQCLRTG